VEAALRSQTDFAAFVREHSRSLFGTAYLLCGSADRAEDLLQDTLASLYPRWERVTEADRPVAYVRRALTNRFVSDGRRPRARDVTMWDVPETGDEPDVADVVADRRLLWALLGTLRERQRAAIVLRYFHGESDERIAAALGCRQVTVRSLISRGIAAMRERSARSETAGGGRR
jgi:RNA polymerase sigma-70 factor (sigma-E family)